LEYLRFGLGRTDKDFDATIDPEHDREARLISETLAKDGYVEVVLEREGVRETWKRVLANSEVITISAAGRTIEVTTSTARERFRSRAFRQKGLSSTMNDPTTASEQITGIAAAEEVDRERNIKRAIDSAQRSVKTAVNNLAALWQSRVDLRQTTEKVGDLRDRIAALAKRLEEEGLSPEALNTIEQGPRYGRAAEYIGTVGSQAADTKILLERFESAALTVDISGYEGARHFDEVAELHQALLDAKAAIKSSRHPMQVLEFLAPCMRSSLTETASSRSANANESIRI
jgi:hypothetical protein